jgi:DNA-binding CsgD family transcriptional regulator
MQEIERIELFLRMYREWLAPEDKDMKGVAVKNPPPPAPNPGRGNYGQAQPIFEQFVRAVLRDVGRPLESGEVIAEFRRRGHPIGGNETRTAWNRLWNAKQRGVLINIPQYGYWLADEPLPSNLPEMPPKRKPRPEGAQTRKDWAGRKQGRTKLLTEAQIKAAEDMIIEGKPAQQICAELGGISLPTYYNYFPGGRNAIIAKRFGLEPPPKTERAPRGHGKPYKRTGRPFRRPLMLSPEQVERARTLRSEAKTFEAVAAELGVSVSTVRRALKRG